MLFRSRAQDRTTLQATDGVGRWEGDDEVVYHGAVLDRWWGGEREGSWRGKGERERGQLGEGCGCWTGKEVMHNGLLSKVSISNFFRLCFEHSFAFLFKFWTTRWWYNPPLTRDFLLFFRICLSDVYSQLRPIFPRPLFGPSSSIMHSAYPFHPTNPSDTSHVLLYKITTALNNNIAML